MAIAQRVHGEAIIASRDADKGRWRAPLSALLVAGGLTWGLVGCEERGEVIESVESHVRERAERGAKAGTLRALELAERARAVGDAHRWEPQVDCRLYLEDETPFVYRYELVVERVESEEETLRWRETRTTRADGQGDIAVELDAEARTELGVTASRHMEWRHVDGTGFASDDGRNYHRTEAPAQSPARLVRLGASTLQTLLDAAPGWQSDGDRRWKVGGRRLVCGPKGGEDGQFLDGLEARTKAVRGRLSTSGGRVEPGDSVRRRDLDLAFELGGGTRLVVEFEDELSEKSKPVEPPPDGRVVDLERDRSLERVERLLERLESEGALKDDQNPSSKKEEERDDATK